MKPEKPDRMFQVTAVWDVLAHDATEALEIMQMELRYCEYHDAPEPDRWDVVEITRGEEDEVQGH